MKRNIKEFTNRVHRNNGTNRLTRKAKPGFTLIELIIIIMVLSLMAALLAPFIGQALTGSHKPLKNLEHASNLKAEMEKVVAVYRSIQPGNLDESAEMNDFQNNIAANSEAPQLDETVAALTVNELVMFEEQTSGGNFEEEACDPTGSLDCVLKVELQSVANPGERLTYYFPYKRQ